MGAKTKWVLGLCAFIFAGFLWMVGSFSGKGMPGILPELIVVPRPEELGSPVPMGEMAASLAPSKEVPLKKSSSRALEVPSQELERLQKEEAIIY